jgi:hypothetical protein
VWVQVRDAVMSPQERNDLEATEQLFRGFTYTGDPEDLWAWGMMIDVHAAYPILVHFLLGKSPP